MPREFTSFTFTEALRTREAYAVLGDELNSWTQGGCWVLAQAIRNWVGPRAALYCVRGRVRSTVGALVVHHVFVRIGDFYLDADGIDRGSERVRTTWTHTERLHEVGIETFLPRYRMNAKREGIVCPPAAVKRVEEFLRKRFGDGEAAVVWMGGKEVRPNPKRGLKERLFRLREKFANAAREVHYEWDQDDNGVCEWRGSGGICDDVSDAIGDVLARYNIDSTDGGQEGDSHAYRVAYDDTEAFGIDIAPDIYETGGGYSWKKRKDAVFPPEVVEIFPVRRSDLNLDARTNPNAPIATAIYTALGGKPAFATIGATRFSQGPDWLLFPHTIAPKNRAHATRITHFGSDAGHDTYRMDFYARAPNSARGVNRGAFVTESVAGLYLDQLAYAFESHTGLSLTASE